MAVVEMPTTRIPPGSRCGLRANGCGACGRRFRPLTTVGLRSTRPFSILTAYCGHTVILESRFTVAGAAVKLVVMPGAHDVVTVERAGAQRPADVIADTGDRAELAVAIRQGDAQSSRLDLAQRRIAQLLDRAQIDP